MKGGDAVAIHCLAGLGRTGTIAARFLMQFGLRAEQAISQIRQQHSIYAIETTAQEKYLVKSSAVTSLKSAY